MSLTVIKIWYLKKIIQPQCVDLCGMGLILLWWGVCVCVCVCCLTGECVFDIVEFNRSYQFRSCFGGAEREHMKHEIQLHLLTLYVPRRNLCLWSDISVKWRGCVCMKHLNNVGWFSIDAIHFHMHDVFPPFSNRTQNVLWVGSVAVLVQLILLT